MKWYCTIEAVFTTVPIEFDRYGNQASFYPVLTSMVVLFHAL